MEPSHRRPLREATPSWWKGPVRPAIRVADLVSVLQILGDLAAILLAYESARQLWPFLTELPGLTNLHENIPTANYRINAILTGLFMIPVFRYLGLYKEQHSLLNIQEYRNILRGWFLTMILTVTAVASIERSFQSRGIFLSVWLLLLWFLFFFRFSTYRLGVHLRRRGWRDRRVLIYGAGDTGRSLLLRLRSSLKTGLEVAGFLDDDASLRGRTVEGVEVLGSGVEMGRILAETNASEILVALPRANRAATLRIVDLCRRHGTSFRLVPSLFDMVVQQVEVLEIGGVPLLGVHVPRLGPARALMKRALDIAVSGTMLVACTPLLLLLAGWIRLMDGAPVFFIQWRVGQGGRFFQMWKFRTMVLESPTYAPTPSSPRDERVTLAGRFLRRTSLDELPQLWNVLRGDMSLVGPRPEMPFIVEKYDDLQKQRLAVKPGMTGLWQVSPDRNSPIHDHIDYDIYYIRHQSLLLDAAIVLKTLSSVVRGTGA